ncbi:MAG: SDR family oxidoreductase [Myxococcota bacterium]
MRFEGQVALVTGGASGIGRAAAEQFSREGARVVVADRDAAAAEACAQAIRDAGGDTLPVVVDVAREDSVAELLDTAVTHYGRLDAAFNNAGVSSHPMPFVDVSEQEWHRVVSVNLTGVFFCMKHQLRVMLAQEPVDGLRGALCASASGAARVPAPGQPHYTAAKHGLLGLVKLVAQEQLAQGIRSNAILPGATDTPMMRDNPPEFVKMLERYSPGGKLGRAEDVAAAAVWLCSREARHVNGQSIVVDGGGILI